MMPLPIQCEGDGNGICAPLGKRSVQTHISQFNAILPGELGLASFSLDSPSLYTIFNTITPCPSQDRRDGGEGRGVEGKYIP